MFKILSKRERIVLYTTIGIIIFAVSFNFLIVPVLTKNDTLNKEINLVRAKLKRSYLLLSQKDNLQSKYRKFFPSTQISGQQEDTLVSALSELEGLAKEANIRIIDIRPQSTPKSSILYQEALIDLRAEGTMEGYLKFIYTIENSPSLLKIKRFQLTAKPTTQILEGSFSISQLSIINTK